MTTVVPKLSKTDTVPFKALKPARAEENSSASFARALKDADSSKAAVRQASEVADNSVRLRSQTGESGALAESGDELTLPENGTISAAGTGSAKSGDLESAAKNSSDSTVALAVDSANVAGVAALLVNPSGTPTAPDANGSTEGALTTEAATDLASSATAKAVELAQAAALWANGGPRDGFGATSTNLGLSSSSMAVAGELSGPAAPSANTAASAKSSAPASATVLSTSQGSTISGVMDPALFAAPGGGVGAGTSFDNSMGGSTVAAGASGASGSVSSGLAGGPIGFGGAAGAVQGAGQAATNALLNAGRSEANVSAVGTAGSRAASFNNTSGAVSVASALAAASVVRIAQSSALSDSAGLSTTAGSITGTLSVPVMSGSAGADLGGNALGTQTGGAGSESGGSSGGSRSGGSNAFTVQASNPSEPNAIASLSGAANASASSARSVDLGTYANATTTAARVTNAASVVDVSANQSPALDVNAPSAQVSVAADPRVAWRDLRSKWDQPIRANAPKG